MTSLDLPLHSEAVFLTDVVVREQPFQCVLLQTDMKTDKYGGISTMTDFRLQCKNVKIGGGRGANR